MYELMIFDSSHSYTISFASYNNFFPRNNRSSDDSFILADFTGEPHDYNTTTLITTGVTLQ
jgi:hypothetical protein